MAKPIQKQEEQTPKPLPSTAAPAFLAQHADDAGKGVSTDREDNLVPLIYVLQPLSPQVMRSKPEYIPGAEPGAIWLRNAPNPILKGEDGFLFQPCHFWKDWVEWVPRKAGGGFVGRHDDCPSDAQIQTDPQNPNKLKHIRPNGNEVIETRYHAGFVIRPDMVPAPYLIALSSTGHTVSRSWMASMGQKQLGGKIAPSWACLYKLTTRERTNASGTWFTWSVADNGWVKSEEEYLRGKALYEAFAAGEKRAEAPVAPDHDNAPM